jgi:Arc/MetJ-type ribon-helix-helix transcriptional regulator
MPLHVAKETEQELRAKVRSGAYPSVDRVIREGLALIEAREAFRQAVREGDAQLALGDTVTRSQSRRRMRKLAKELQKAR